MKKLIPFVIAAVVAVGIYSCQKDATPSRTSNGSLSMSKKDTTPPSPSLKLAYPSTTLKAAKDTTPPSPR